MLPANSVSLARPLTPQICYALDVTLAVLRVYMEQHPVLLALMVPIRTSWAQQNVVLVKQVSTVALACEHPAVAPLSQLLVDRAPVVSVAGIASDPRRHLVQHVPRGRLLIVHMSRVSPALPMPDPQMSVPAPLPVPVVLL